jgi:hypothetical protein
VSINNNTENIANDSRVACQIQSNTYDTQEPAIAADTAADVAHPVSVNGSAISVVV